MSAEALDRWRSGVPARPYCSDDPRRYGVRIRPRVHALGKNYVQPNHPLLTKYLAFDVDQDGAAFAAEDAGLPVPTFTIINSKSAHAHLIYELKNPVRRGYSDKADRYMAAVCGGLGRRLGADQSYRGLLVQNPVSDRWNTLATDATYDLGDLAEAIPPTMLRPLERRLAEHPDEVAIGRNVDLFNRTRLIAYRLVHTFGAKEEFAGRILNLCAELNQYSPPLPFTEVRSISRSITRWTWANRDRLAGRKWRPLLSPAEVKSRQQASAQRTHAMRVSETAAAILKAQGILAESG
jgi:hypothetical protein